MSTDYQQEPIQGLTGIVLRVVRKRLDAMADREERPTDWKDTVHATIDEWEPQRIYDLSPFGTFLSTYPGPHDFHKLGVFHWTLRTYLANQKEMNAWANALIESAEKELWPRRNPFTTP